MTTLSSSVVPLVPFSASTPMISKLAEPSWIVCPSGFCPVENRLLSTVWPIRTTRLRFVTSALVIGLPAASV
jgi:hypothetical protein